MFFFRKKKEAEIESDAENLNEDITLAPESNALQKQSDVSAAADIARIKASVEAFSDVRKALNERITRLTEQIGEIKAMIADRDRLINQVELKATKASDLVEAVHPDQQMFEIKKQDAKVDALKANIESNEILMKRVLDELKELRGKMATFRGIEEIVKMNQEVKGEIIQIKKVEANIEKHSDKVETIFAEVQKKFIDFEKINDVLKGNEKQITDNAKAIESVRVKGESFAQKKSVDELISKFSQLRVDVTNVISLLNRRFAELDSSNRRQLEMFERALERKFNVTKESLREAVSALQSVNPDDIAKMQETIPAESIKPSAAASPAESVSPEDGKGRGIAERIGSALKRKKSR